MVDSAPRPRQLRHVVVLGANGTMGFGSGALFTRAVPKVTFLARTRDKAAEGLAAAIRQVRSPTVADRVEVGSYSEDLERALADADLVFEAVTEQLDLKHEFFARIDAARRPDAIVATVTSGLSIDALAAPRSESFRRHFLGLHFFNPPNVITGTELVPGCDTDPAIVDFVETFAARELGRAMVRTLDAPGFAGNRVGFQLLNEVAQLAEEHGPSLMDTLVGRYTGRALPPLATIDLVGWDIHRAIVDNIHALCPADERRDTLALPPYMARLMASGTLGSKSGRGFFARDGKRKLALDPRTGDYTPIDELPKPEGVEFIRDVTELHRVGRYADAMACFAAARGPMAALAQRVIAGYIAYAYARVGEVTETIDGIDRIMGFGFNWAPPSVLLDVLGPEATIGMVKAAGLEVPDALAAAAALPAPRFRDAGVDVGKFFVAA
ncbi:MAG: 3-hydroxyacyl-CoA dehydrogenase family protein [Myxococcales bacterium]|nr:3-hydroxyacyl-CoA dehydrogenase family protein [Myxococcales bacterium]MCB9521152.1 3-hydroxyacyl-CoA dehydrogenase family protein [Myxococcales bacterium]MCB9530178.1 3-hydroxyacyl-CoA dehydrogenase family protein [Myxococcales bacterium]